MSGILVVAEHRQGRLAESTLECLAAAWQLAQASGDQVTCALLADQPQDLAPELQGRSHSLRLMSHPELANYNPEPYLAALEPLINELRPAAVLMGHTSQGLDLAPALAGRLGLPLVTDCAGLEQGQGAWQVRRNPYGGKLIEEITLKPAPSVVITLQGGAYSAPEQAPAQTQVEQTPLSELTLRHARRFLEYIAAAQEEVDIAEADILVSVGRGIGSPDNLALAQELADALGATLSCSRPVADAGWLPKGRQVGTSGKTVRPKLYIALGISGAFQHQAGMKNSGTILAVNKDPRAPIFQVAHYGIVEDLFQVIPLLLQQLKN